MGTIIDYIKEYGKYTFLEKPFNEVDSLVLSQFSYLKFDGIVPEIGDMVDIKYLYNHVNYDNLYGD